MQTPTKPQNTYRLHRTFWVAHCDSGLEDYIPALTRDDIEQRIVKETSASVWVNLTDDEACYLYWDARRQQDIYDTDDHDFMSQAEKAQGRSARSIVRELDRQGIGQRYRSWVRSREERVADESDQAENSASEPVGDSQPTREQIASVGAHHLGQDYPRWMRLRETQAASVTPVGVGTFLLVHEPREFWMTLFYLEERAEHTDHEDGEPSDISAVMQYSPRWEDYS